MKILYLECNAGASGDMLVSALADLLQDPKDAKRIIESAGIPGIEVIVETSSKSKIGGTMVRILVNGQEEGSEKEHKHIHRSIGEVLGIIDGLNVSDNVRKRAKDIYSRIAQAESEVHGEPVSEIHFHEVGMLDAIADVVGACLLMEKLSPDYIVSSPLRTGFGYVRCAHGNLPIPAPATASLLKGMESYSGDYEGEFTTPTGAALVGYFAEEYGQRPRMSIDGIGVGIGHHDYDIPNILRAFIGECEERLFEIYEINCNIDDMTPEDLGPIIDKLLDEGALDATLCQMVMKKGRPGYRLTCLCRQNDKDRLAKLIMANTSTIGLRMWRAERFEMTSRMEVCSTVYGDIRIKISEGYGIVKWKPEHDDLVSAAERNGVSIRQVRDAIRFETKK